MEAAHVFKLMEAAQLDPKVQQELDDLIPEPKAVVVPEPKAVWVPPTCSDADLKDVTYDMYSVAYNTWKEADRKQDANCDIIIERLSESNYYFTCNQIKVILSKVLIGRPLFNADRGAAQLRDSRVAIRILNELQRRVVDPENAMVLCESFSEDNFGASSCIQLCEKIVEQGLFIPDHRPYEDVEIVQIIRRSLTKINHWDRGSSSLTRERHRFYVKELTGGHRQITCSQLSAVLKKDIAFTADAESLSFSVLDDHIIPELGSFLLDLQQRNLIADPENLNVLADVVASRPAWMLWIAPVSTMVPDLVGTKVNLRSTPSFGSSRSRAIVDSTEETEALVMLFKILAVVFAFTAGFWWVVAAVPNG